MDNTTIDLSLFIARFDHALKRIVVDSWPFQIFEGQ